MFSALSPNTLEGEGLLLAKGMHWVWVVLGELWADHKTRKTPHTAHEQDATGTQTRVSLGKICAHAHTHTHTPRFLMKKKQQPTAIEKVFEAVAARMRDERIDRSETQGEKWYCFN